MGWSAFSEVYEGRKCTFIMYKKTKNEENIKKIKLGLVKPEKTVYIK